MKHIDKKRIQKDIEDAAGRNAEHRIKRIALKTEHVVHAERAHKEGHAEQGIARVGRGIGRYGRRRTEAVDQLPRTCNAKHREQRTYEYLRKESGRHIALRLLYFLLPEQTRNFISTAHAYHEGHRLDARHQRKDHADRRRGRGAEL